MIGLTTDLTGGCRYCLHFTDEKRRLGDPASLVQGVSMQVAEQDLNPGSLGPGPVLLACWPTSLSPPLQGAGNTSSQSRLGPGPAWATVTAGRSLAQALPIDSGGSVRAVRFLGPLLLWPGCPPL